jgi:hypothetical protein
MPGFPFPAVGPLDLGSPPYRSESSDHRYYCRLRLPNVHLGIVRCSLSAPNTLVAPLLSLTGQDRAFLSSARTPPHWLTGALDRVNLPRKHLALPSSQATPLTACPALRPRWCFGHLPWCNQNCCLPLPKQRRLLSGFSNLSNDHHEHDFGAQSHSLQSRSIWLRTPVAGLTRRFHY